MKRFLLLITMTIVVAACGNATATESTAVDDIPDIPEEVASTTSATPTTDEPVSAESTTTSPPREGMTYVGVEMVPEVLKEFVLTTVGLDDEELLVAIAATGAQRQQGLMNVSDMGTLDGMVFVFEQDSSGGFWMKDTLIPLDIAFFDADGKFVDGFVMEPCTTETCPKYRPSDRYRYALEVPAGDMQPNPQVLVLAPKE